ncbi:MAG: P-loop NTPase [Desulfobacterales bacterium]|jgi:CO dehydrogenase maturation factor|nr:P-loop NTPase [Desulfobacteraceae bacterium]MDD3993524.1 P-loop NTPase [Desulfobacteraceae bacterium]MDY0313007.1 P-loop NTPase [Desulfobacterales bacterium]
MKISVCGKGGSGKSTVVTFLAKQALRKNLEVLVVDADDSNAGLARMLGFDSHPLPLMEMVGGKAMIKKKMGGQTLLNQATIRTGEFQPEFIRRQNGLMLVGIGKILQTMEGCACPMGVLNREFLKKLTLEPNQIALVDMEAGVEHFGRGIDEAIDKVLVVVEPSFDSLQVAAKIKSMASSMGKKVVAIINKSPSETITKKIEQQLTEGGLAVIGVLPQDPSVFEACLTGDVPQKGEAFEAVPTVLDRLLSA